MARINRSLQHAASLLILLLALQTHALAQGASRESLGLTGASIIDMAGSADGAAVVALAEGPLGVFYSTDFGDTWVDARDTTYTGGQGVSATFTEDAVFVVTGGNDGAHIYKSALGATLSWTQIDEDSVGFDDLIPTSVASDGTFVFVGTKESRLLIFDATSGEFLSSSLSPATPGLDQGQINSIALDSEDGIIYIQTGLATGVNSGVYRATYNTNTGAVTSAWTSKKPTGSGFHRVYVAPNGMLYVTTFSGNAFQSTDNGDSYTTLVNGDGGHAGQDASFSGNTHFVGFLHSTNAGASFTALRDVTGDSTERSAKGLYVDPTNANAALMSSDLGVAKTENLNAQKSGTWEHSNTGLEGVVVNAMAQLAGSKDRVVLATNNGIAFTNNFTAASPTWNFPLRPLDEGGLLAQSAAFNPTDTNTVYVGDTDIYVGTISGSSIAWDTIRRDNTPGSHGAFGFVTSLTYLEESDTLVATWRENSLSAINGKISFIDPSDGSEIRTALNGKPVKAFIAVSETLMFAGVGAEDSTLDGNDDSTNKGIYRSTDGGSTWEKLTDDDFLISDTQFLSFAYDADNDILYCGVRGFENDDEDDCNEDEEDCDDICNDDEEDCDDDEVDDDEDDSVDDDGGFDVGGAVLMLDNASGDEASWRLANSIPANASSFGAVAIDAATKTVYVSAGKYIYRSFDNGENWQVFYEGLESENTSMLFFDALVQGSNTGFYSVNSASVTSPAYFPWNGFAGTNVIELGNGGTETLSVTATLYDSTGTARGAVFVSLEPNKQFDILVNILEGFSSTSYGVVKLTWSGNGLNAKATQYAQGTTDYAFAQAIPPAAALSGSSAAIFNTYYPSLHALDTNSAVQQWFTVINLGDEQEIFTVFKYDAAGTEISEVDYQLSPLERIDIEAGHVSPGKNNVGLMVVEPNGSGQYYAALTRYGVDGNLGVANFAAYHPARQGVGSAQWLRTSNGANARCFVEVANTGDAASDVDVTFYDNGGTVLASIGVNLPSLAQYHFDACAFFSGTNSGAVKVAPRGGNGEVIANSTVHFQSSAGRIDTAYLLPAVNVSSGDSFNSWNTFLGMYNWLRLFNTSTSDTVVTVTVFSNTSGQLKQVAVGLPAKSGFDFALHDNATFGTSSNDYGLVKINSSGPILADVLRIKPNSNGAGVDFATIVPNQ